MKVSPLDEYVFGPSMDETRRDNNRIQFGLVIMNYNTRGKFRRPQLNGVTQNNPRTANEILK